MSRTTSLRAPEGDPAEAAEAITPTDPLRAQRDALKRLVAAVAERAESERVVNATYESKIVATEQEYERKRQALAQKLAQLEADAAAADERIRRELAEAASSAETRAKNDFAAGSRRIAAEFDGLRQTAKSQLARDRNDAIGGHDAGKKVAAKEHAVALKPIHDARAILESQSQRLAVVAEENRKLGLDPEPAVASRESYSKYPEPADELFQRLARMDPPLKLLERLIIPKLTKGANEGWIYGLTTLGGAALGLLFGGDVTVIAVLAGVGLALGLAARMKLITLGKEQAERLYKPLMKNAADAAGLASYAEDQINLRFQETLKALTARQEKDLEQAKERHTLAIARGEADRDERLRQINEVYGRKLRENQEEQERRSREAAETSATRRADRKSKGEAGSNRLDEDRKTTLDQARAVHETDRRASASRWLEAATGSVGIVDDVARFAKGLGLDWEAPRASANFVVDGS